tara:strand:+ start:1962 stop:2882 length:921 start_codon:yes stop_codon:yes gene_type:complete
MQSFSTIKNLKKVDKNAQNYTYPIQHGGLRTKGWIKENDIENKLPLFSIITVVYNRSKFIERCIRSVLNQTYQNIEYIIIDGKSNDGTLKIIKSYEEYLDLWTSEQDEGIYDAINKGINYSNGFTLMLHSDDCLADENVLLNISKGILSNNEIIFGSVKNYNEIVEWVYPQLNDTINNLWVEKNPIPHQSVFIFHTIHKKFLFTERDLSIANDKLVLTKLSKIYKVKYIPLIVSLVQLGGESNDWKSLKKVFDTNRQHFLVNKKLEKFSSLKEIVYLYASSIIKFFVFRYLGKLTFYKLFYRKFLK